MTVGASAAAAAADGWAPAVAGADGQAADGAADGFAEALTAGPDATGLAAAEPAVEGAAEMLGADAAADGLADAAGAADDGFAAALGETEGLLAGATVPPQAASMMLRSATLKPRDLTFDRVPRFATASSSWVI
ncbi:MAG TPA: hypothetical protein VIR57_21135 [Chloroflexota bacterium]